MDLWHACFGNGVWYVPYSYLFRQGMLEVIFDRISRNVKLQPKVFVSGRKLFLKTLIHYRVEQELSTDR